MSIGRDFQNMEQDQIRRIVKGNASNIADNSLRIMAMQSGIDELLELGEEIREARLEQREFNSDMKDILKQLIENNKDMRRDIDELIRLSDSVWDVANV